MAETFLCDLRVHAVQEKMRRMAVPKVMEPDPREPLRLRQDAREFVREAVRLNRQAVRLRIDVGVAGEPDTEA